MRKNFNLIESNKPSYIPKIFGIELIRSFIKNRSSNNIALQAIQGLYSYLAIQECDMVNPYVLKEASVEFAEPLQLIFERSINTGKVPKVWLDAHVIPIFKKGATNDPGN